MKKLLIGVAIVLVVGIVGLALALMRVDIAQFRPQIQSSLGASLGRPVTVGNMALSLRHLAFTAEDIRIGEDPAFGKEPFVAAERLSVQVALWPLLTQRALQVTQLALQQPRIHLIQNKQGRWNFESVGEALAANAAQPASAVAPTSMRIDALRVSAGELGIRFDDGSERKLSELSIAADGLASDRAFSASISAIGPGGAHARIDGQVGPLAAGDMLLTPLTARLALTGFDLGSGVPGGGLAGALGYQGDASLKDGAFRLSGNATLERLRLYPDAAAAPAPVTFAHRLDYDLKSRRGELARGELAIGAARLGINGKLDHRAAGMNVDLAVAGKALPVNEVQGLLPMLGMALPENSKLDGGTLNLALRAQGALDALHISGPMRLEHSRLKGFSLGSKVTGMMALVGLHVPEDTVIESAAADMKLDASGVAMRNIVAVVAELGRLTGEGTVNAKSQLDFHLRIQPDAALAGGNSVGGTSVASALQGVVGKSSRDGIGLAISGSAAQPQFKVDTGAVAGALIAGLVAGKSGNANAAGTSLDKAALEGKAADALLNGLFGKKKPPAPEPEPAQDGKR